MPPLNLAELKNRLQDQHRVLTDLNEQLIRELLRYAVSNDNRDQPFTPAKTFKDAIGYLRAVKMQVLTIGNLKLITVASNIPLLAEISAEMENEIRYHNELKQRMEEIMSNDQPL